MAITPAKLQVSDEVILVKLAREIAVDFYELPEVLARNGVNDEQWQRIKNHPRFIGLLTTASAEWNSSLNTSERTKLKAAALIEEFLPEANQRLHDQNEALPGKVSLLQQLSKIAGVDAREPAGAGGAPGERFSITINLGADAKLTFDKEVTSKVIDVTPVEG